jgi:hypothetical protein
MVDLTPEQFADKLERHLNGTEGAWDWDNLTSIRIRDKRLDRLPPKDDPIRFVDLAEPPR